MRQENNAIAVPVDVRRDVPEATVVTEPLPADAGQNPLLMVHALLRGRYPWVILLALVLGAGGAAAGYWLAPIRYQSRALIRIKPNLPRVIYQNEQNGVMPMFDAFVESQISLIQSQRVIDAAMQRPQWKALGRGLEPAMVARFAQELEVLHPRNTEMIQVSFMDPDPNAAMVAVRSVVDVYQELYRERNDGSDGERLRVLESRRDVLTSDLEALNKAIQGIAQEFGSTTLGPIYDFKLAELNKLESEWKQAQLALALAEAMQGGQASTTQPGSGQPVPGQPVSDQPASGSVLAGAGPTTRPGPKVRTPEMIALADSTMQSYLVKRQTLLDEVERLERRLGKNHPTVLDMYDSLVATDKLIASRVEFFSSAEAAGWIATPGGDKDAFAPMPVSLDRVRARAQSVETLYREAKRELIEIGNKKLRIEQKQAEADNVRQRLDETKARIEQLNVESSVGGRLEVFSHGDKPLVPFNDKRKAIVATAGLGGMGLGIGIFLLIGLVDRRLRYVEDAHGDLRQDIPLLGVLPELPDRLNDDEDVRLAGQCVHHVRTLLQIHRDPVVDKVFTITSPSAASGKTSLTAALGLSFASCGSKTLLIDCDIIGGGLTAKMDTIIRRKIGQVLRREGLVTTEQVNEALEVARVSGRPLGETLVQMGYASAADVEHALAVQRQSVVGLLDAMAGEPLADCVTGTGIPGLFILPLGGAAAHHVPQLSPISMRRIFAEARAGYDTVLVDTGPVLGSLEAALSATESDKVILVLARGERRHMMRRAVEFLSEAGVGVAGAVFNRARYHDVVSSSSFSSSMSMRSVSRHRTPGRIATDGQPLGQTVVLGPIASAAQYVTQAGRQRGMNRD